VTNSTAPERQGGFTIIELVVALGILALVAAGIAPVFWTAMKTAGVANHRTAGAAIASREMEGMRSVAYDSVGFYESQTGYTSEFDGLETVTLGATAPVPALIEPQDATPEVQRNVSYTIQRRIVWIDAADDSSTYDDAYKRLTTIVTWSDAAGPHEVRQDSILYPGGLGEYAGAKGASSVTTTSTTSALAPVAPALAAAVVPADPAGRTEIDLAWSQPSGGAPITGYTVEYSTDSSFSAGTTNAISGLPASATSHPITALSSSTTYYFRVTAVASGQTAVSNEVSATTLAQPVTTCVIGGLTVTGAEKLSTTGTILKKQGGKNVMSENLTLGFQTTGPCTDAYQVRGVSPSGTTDPGSPYALIANGSGSYSGSVASNGQQGWSVGLHAFTVWNVTTNAATAAVKTFKVCAFGSKTC
jgi:prepilin-type N-terminal cleavage/methylation domain-containing protein